MEYELFEKKYLSLLQNYAQFEKQVKEIEKEKDDTRAMILKAMQENEIRGFENDILSITVVAPSVSTTIDTKVLRADDPDEYDKLMNKYPKVTHRKESLRIKVK